MRPRRRAAVLPGERCQVDDATVALSGEVAPHRLAADKGAAQIGGDHAIELVDANLHYWRCQRQRGVVDQHL
ncbi:hypothetical protein D3C86_1630090 [compost metagenome]